MRNAILAYFTDSLPFLNHESLKSLSNLRIRASFASLSMFKIYFGLMAPPPQRYLSLPVSRLLIESSLFGLPMEVLSFLEIIFIYYCDPFSFFGQIETEQPRCLL